MTLSQFTVFLGRIPTHVNVFKNTELQAVIQIPEPIQSFSLTPSSSSGPEEWILLLGSKTGHVYRTNDTEYKKQLKHHCQEFQASLENQQIFTDLLVPKLLDCETGNAKGHGLASPESFVHALSSAEIILSVRSSIMDVCQTLGFIFTVIKEDDVVKVLSFSSDIGSAWAKPLMVHVLERKARYQRTCDEFHLYFLTCNLIKYPDQERSYSTIDISNDIFKSIGSVDIPLCNSPILLLTLGEGSVYYSPLNAQPSSSQPLQFSLLYPTSKPIVNIQPCNLNLKEKNDAGTDSPFDQKTVSCLAMCSSNGDSVILTCDEKNGAQMVSFTIPSSLTDIEIVGQKLYFSSGEDLLVCDITLLERENKYEVELLKMSSLRFAGAMDIHCILDIGFTEEVVSHILCRTGSGKIAMIDVHSRINQPGLNRTQRQGQQIRELLTAIENCHLQVQELKSRESRQREFISQLNIASHLISSKGLLKCKYKILQKVKGEDFFLACEVTNLSGIKLSCDWSLLVDIHQPFPHKSSSGSERLDWGVDPNESVDIKIGLPSQDTKIHYHVIVTLCLHFPVDLHSETSQSDKVLSIVVDQETIDILHFLFDEKCLHQKTVQTRFNLNTAITELALRRPVPSSRSVNAQSAAENPVTRMNLFKSTSLLNESEISCYGEGVDAVLKFLTQTSECPVDIVNHEVKLVDPTGEPVKLAIEMLDLDKDTAKAKLKLTIVSREITLAAAVREAVMRRLQSVDKIGDGETAKENLPKETLVSIDLSTILTSTTTKKDVIEVYRQLRCGHVNKLN